MNCGDSVLSPVMCKIGIEDGVRLMLVSLIHVPTDPFSACFTVPEAIGRLDVTGNGLTTVPNFDTTRERRSVP